MSRRRIVAGAATIAALAGGAAGAVAAGNDDKATEKAVLTDAAKRLGVTSDKLRDALSAAEDAQLDAAVKAGRLTQAQADELKKRRQADGSVLRLGPDGDGDHHGRFGGPGFDHGPGGGPLGDVADALGITEQQLFGQLRAGKSLADVAKAHGKTLADARSAVKARVTKRLDADLAAGRITKAQHDEEVQELDEHLGHLGERPDFDHGFRRGPRPAPPAP